MRARLSAIVGLFIGVALLVPTCLNQRFSRVAANRVTIRMARTYEPPSQRNGRVVGPGDFILESSTIRVVVGGLMRSSQERGAVLEAMLHNNPLYESIDSLTSRLQVGGGNYPIFVQDIYATWRGNKPVLRSVGLAWVGKRSFRVVQELTLDAETPVLISRSETTSLDGRKVSDVGLGVRIDWGGATPFVPGTGTLEDAQWHRGDFIGNSANATSTLFGFQENHLRAAAKLEWSGVTQFLSHTDVIPLSRTLPTQGKLTEKSYLIIKRGGLAQAARRLGWVRGKPFREVLAVLPYMPEGSKITIYDSENAPYVYAYPEPNGQAIIPLPVGKGEKLDREYVAVATAYGHARSDPVTIPEQRGIRLTIEIPEGGHIRIRATDAASGLPMSARARIIGLGDTPSPDLGPRYRAAGAENIVVTAGDEVIIPAEPGEYRVLVSHGPEWSLYDQTIEVTKTFRPDVQADLTRLMKTRDWIACDFHVHAAPSYDSLVSLEDRVTSLAAEGIRFAVPTDHNHVTDYGPAIESIKINDFGTVTGVEVTTWNPEFGHFNVFPYPQNPNLPNNGAPPYQNTSAAELFGDIRALDPQIAIQVNHPRLEPSRIAYFDQVGFDPKTGASTGPYSGNYDLLEVWNGYDLARSFMFERVFLEWIAMLARGDRHVATGSSDSHNISYQWAGYPRTYVWVKGGDPSDGNAIIQSLKNGHAMVTNGPMLEATVNGQGPGETAVVSPGKFLVSVHVQAPPWMEVSYLEVFANGKKVVEQVIGQEFSDLDEPPVIRFNGDIEIPMEEEGFIVIIIKGGRPMTEFFGIPDVFPAAFINPIWINFEQKPRESDAGVDAGVLE